MSIVLTSAIGSIALPNPLIGDAIRINTGITYQRTLNGKIRTHQRQPAVQYEWTFRIPTCNSVRATLASGTGIQQFFKESRGRELQVVPFWGGMFRGYFDMDELEVEYVRSEYIFTLLIGRRLADQGDIR